MIQRRKRIARSTKPLKRTGLKKKPRRAARRADPRFNDPRSHVTKDGRVRLYGEDMTDLRRTVFAESGERCWNMKLLDPELCRMLKLPFDTRKRCYLPIAWDTFHLMHGAHGHGFRNDVPRTEQNPDGCIAGCAECHQREHGHY